MRVICENEKIFLYFVEWRDRNRDFWFRELSLVHND